MSSPLGELIEVVGTLTKRVEQSGSAMACWTATVKELTELFHGAYNQATTREEKTTILGLWDAFDDHVKAIDKAWGIEYPDESKRVGG